MTSSILRVQKVPHVSVPPFKNIYFWGVERSRTAVNIRNVDGCIFWIEWHIGPLNVFHPCAPSWSRAMLCNLEDLLLWSWKHYRTQSDTVTLQTTAIQNPHPLVSRATLEKPITLPLLLTHTSALTHTSTHTFSYVSKQMFIHKKKKKTHLNPPYPSVSKRW